MKRVKPVNSVIFRTTILTAIRRQLDAVKQWSSSEHWSHATLYDAKAEVLINLLEADDCGSHGGFDQERGQDGYGSGLEARYQWLLSLKESE